jgi:hypothetical protein
MAADLFDAIPVAFIAKAYWAVWGIVLILSLGRKAIPALLVIVLGVGLYQLLGMLGWITTIVEVFMDIIPFLILVGFLICACLPQKDSNQQPQLQLPTIRPPMLRKITVPNIQPTVVYHGGPWGAVMDIFRNNRWHVGPSKEIWFTSSPDIAKNYARSKGPGAIIELRVDSYVALNDKGNGIYAAPVHHAEDGKYYRIAGIRPVRILDTDNSRKIAA